MTRPAAVPPTTLDDQALVLRMASGDEQVVGQLYDRYGPVLYATAYRITGESADAEEVVMDAFAQAWRDAARYDPRRGSVGAWLMTITRTRALDLVRSRGRRARTLEELTADPTALMPALPGGDPVEATERNERRRQLGAALQTLSAPQRQAVELAFYGGLSHSEIAERLDEPLGTVKTRVRLGLQKLREALRPYYGMSA
ncbi:MAG TPA: sigma-70 family RNA polymerase sigma factor [Gemmatimonadales bacterium]|nr:sigma-70 family RNA polymerase sigma factor [Gemmatimonadales bacterium]